MTMPDDPSYKGFRVETLHAFVQVDENDIEGVVGVETRMGMMPLVASDRVRLDDLRVFARMVAKSTRRPVVLKTFTMISEDEVFKP